MVTNGNERYGENDLTGPYHAGKALGMMAKPDVSLIVLLGADLAFRVVAQVFMDMHHNDAVLVVDRVIHQFLKGYQDGQREGKRP